MLPKWHILYGAIFTVILYFIFRINLLQSILIFFSSVIIDVDHYFWYIKNKRDFSLKRAYNWHIKMPKDLPEPFLHIFHVIEILIVLSILSYFWIGFLFVLIGILFHSILDLIEMSYYNTLKLREFSILNYLIRKKLNKKIK